MKKYPKPINKAYEDMTLEEKVAYLEGKISSRKLRMLTKKLRAVVQ